MIELVRFVKGRGKLSGQTGIGIEAEAMCCLLSKEDRGAAEGSTI